MPPSEQIPFEGVLNCWNDDHDLPDLLLSISRSGKSGRLQFSNPEGDKTLYMKEGKIAFAESSSQDDGLGQYLLRTDQISLMDYTRVSRLVQPGKRLGALLIEQKVLDQTELRPAVVGQVRAIILGLFRRTETWYSFKEGEAPPPDAITLDIHVAEIVLEGVRFVESWRRISKGVGSLESVYRRARDESWSGLDLDPNVRELLDMSLEPVSLEEICTKAVLPDFEACRYLWAFRSLGWIENVEEQELAARRDAATAPAVDTPQSLVETQVAVEPPEAPIAPAKPAPIPESLIETRVAIERPSMAPPPAEEAGQTAANDADTQLGIEPLPERPTPHSADPAHTQLAIEPPPEVAAEPPSGANAADTQLGIEPPPAERPTPPAADPAHTQLAIEPPLGEASEPPEPADEEDGQSQAFGAPPPAPEPVAPPPGSTGEYMESILEGSSDASPPKAPPALVDEGATQVFEGPSAMPEEHAAEASPPPPRSAPSGFEALMDDGPSAPAPGPPSPADTPTLPSIPPAGDPGDGQMASFGDVSMPDVPAADELIDSPPPQPEPFVPREPAETPTLEAQVVRADPTGEPLPTAEELLPPSSSRPAKSGGVDLEKEFRHVLDDKS